jgi:hypothetical protein
MSCQFTREIGKGWFRLRRENTPDHSSQIFLILFMFVFILRAYCLCDTICRVSQQVLLTCSLEDTQSLSSKAEFRLKEQHKICLS